MLSLKTKLKGKQLQIILNKPQSILWDTPTYPIY